MAEMPGTMNASEAATISRAKISRKSPEFRRVTLAMFAAGFATFALMYCVQPLLPVFSKQFGVSAAGASFALSFTTATLAVALLVASALSEALGRKRVMVVSVLGAALLTIVSAAIPGWTAYLAIRAAIGLVMSGVPAVAMGYLAEEMDSDAIGLAMGLFIGGSGFGGMSGRLVTSVLTDAFGWRIALAALGGPPPGPPGGRSGGSRQSSGGGRGRRGTPSPPWASRCSRRCRAAPGRPRSGRW